ncbi:bifunctional 2-polyprenyl-6-hydroxyphenol methylase/3-demethylubiquinol 3-O-methyltransferase UbiG [uncultured Finegoldia sp.]|uniref:class I SAM-dependent methyltransferase n=1 Tax=uncultured Finegoldia sp. TaxID=328009 RepID=UPI00261D27AE|nr:class I SAM-dependent methyltransferase [uncultured Finegoldia sp.]
MSEFYNSISESYEDIFKPNEKQINFLVEKAKYKILDVACATGKVAAKMKEKGFDVVGIDLEEKFVDIARKTNKINAVLMNMLDIDQLKDDFDLIYCIGNSLVHLSSAKQVDEFLKKSYDKLTEGGNLVIQIINFYPFLKVEGDFLGSLPTIKNDKVEFVRKYFRNDDYIRFNTVMSANAKSIENNVDLLPITADELVNLLEKNKFKNIKSYGGFDKSKFDKKTSTPLVICANK